MKIAYLGYDAFYPCLEAAFDASDEIIKIFTFPTDNIYEFNEKIISFARKHKIPYTDKRITENDIKELKEKGCNLLVCAGYIYKIPINDGLEGINMHPALLPVGRGPWPMPVTILKGINISGVTIHRIAKDFDTGNILMQKKIYLNKNDNLTSFMKKIIDIAPGMVSECIANYDILNKKAKKQGIGEYFSEPDENEMTFDENTPIYLTDRIVRAFDGYGCIFNNKGRNIKIMRGKCFFENHNFEHGSMQKYKGHLCYAINGGFLRVFDV